MNTRELTYLLGSCCVYISKKKKCFVDWLQWLSFGGKLMVQKKKVWCINKPLTKGDASAFANLLILLNKYKGINIFTWFVLCSY